MVQGSKYQNQRKPKTTKPPNCGIKWRRLGLGLTLEALADNIHANTGRRYGLGTLSAFESGTRGASAELLSAIETALGLPSGEISVDYTPLAARGPSQAPSEKRRATA